MLGLKKKKELSGFTLLELVFEVALVCLLLASFTSIVKDYGAISGMLGKKIDKARLKIKGFQIVNGVARDLDTHRINFLPIIHPKGEIKFADGRVNPVSNNVSLKPASDSTAITSFALSWTESLLVLNLDKTGERGVACLKYLSKFRSFPKENFMALTNEFFFEAHVALAPISDKPSCYEIKVEAGKSMLWEIGNVRDLRVVVALVPIKKIYTVYLDRKNTLRYLGHRLGENIENQPILAGIKSIKFKTVDPNSEIMRLIFIGETFDGKKIVSGASNILTRLDLVDLII
ncbi:MAG TPA: hypothetical protein PKD37_02590 [Oligoflexia bacterium]|nr:hypothetical protein [Oligoflexia bacterium]HMP26858.1 hypothetical protein [Oligoflexia bacterium]